MVRKKTDELENNQEMITIICMSRILKTAGSRMLFIPHRQNMAKNCIIQDALYLQNNQNINNIIVKPAMYILHCVPEPLYYTWSICNIE